MAIVWLAVEFSIPVAQAGGRDWRLLVLLTTLALAGVLILGVLIILLSARWRKQQLQERLTPNEQLAYFRSLYERGELSAEEFDRIRAHLGQQICKEMNVLASPPTPRSDTPRLPEPPPDGIQPPQGTA